MKDLSLHAKAMHDALAIRLPYTFRHGRVLVTIEAVSHKANMFSVLQATASYDGRAVSLDLPFHYINAPTEDHPLLDAQAHIADTIRHIVGSS